MTAKNIKIAAIVPIRAQSVRVINKNFRNFAGKPLYHHILETLCASELIAEVWIDTDSDFLLEEAAKLFPVKLIKRPERLLGDMVPMNDILLHDVEMIEADYYLQTHCTNPLLTTATINKAIDQFLISENNDSLFSVTKVQKRFYDADGKPVNHDPKVLLRTQDLPPFYEENSNIYLFSRDSLKQQGNRIGEKPLMFPMSAVEALDIDEEADFQIAEATFLQRQNEGI